MSQQVTSKTFHGGHGRLRRRAHVPTNLLGCELEVNPVRRQVVGPRGLAPKASDLTRRERLVVHKLLDQRSESWGRRLVALLVDAQTLKEAVGLSWIGFVLKACLGLSNGPVEKEDLLGIVLARTKTPAVPQLILAF